MESPVVRSLREYEKTRVLNKSSSTEEAERFGTKNAQHISGKRSYSVSVTTDEPGLNGQERFVFLSEISDDPQNCAQMSANLSQPGFLQAGPSPSSYRHASFSEGTCSAPINPPPVIRRESMTRLFLKPNAVFVAFEEELKQQQEQQRAASQQARIKRFASIEDETNAKTKSEPDNLNDAPSRPQQPSSTRSTSEGQPSRIRRSTSITQQSSATTQFAAEARRRCSAFVAMESLKKEDPDEVYKINKQLGTGRFGFVKLAEHRESGKTIALKFFPRPQTKQADFLREYNFSKFLSPHQHIIDTFNGIFQANDDSAYYFVQEFAPYASLREMVENSSGGISESATKNILLSVVSAVDFMHGENLVHRNLKAENILIFSLEDLTKVKVADFGLTRKEDSSVKNLDYTNVYHAPELVVNEFLTVHKSIDIWALGILFYYCLKGKFPWQKASIICKPYFEWNEWLKHKIPQLPRRYDIFTEKSIKLQKRCLIARGKDRWTCKDIKRYLEKERLLKPAKSITKQMTIDESYTDAPDKKDKSTIHGWFNSTLKMVTEISEQVVSARNE
ncbi:putative serine/threonine-protein kinase C01C4.3 [Aphelenchoides bicaudatus]|nr:putative serine/threonine-protein kinase C01C4.3 [Aphelenchoides bicaudatus]